MAKDVIKYDGITLTAGSPSSGGKARFFAECEDHKTKTEIDGKVYTVYHNISLYEEGTVPKKIEPETEKFDSAARKVKRTVDPKPVTSDGGNADLKSQLVALAAAMGMKLV